MPGVTKKQDAPKRAVVYARISRDSEGQGLGIARQEEDCRRLAERLQVNIAAVYIDNDTSASTRSKKPRPQFDEMMEAGRRGDFNVLLAYSNSRLTRRPAEWNDLIDLHERYGVVIHTVASGSADLSRADGRAVARTIAAWDAAEAERIGERVARMKLQSAEEGRNHGGTRAFGWKDDNLVADPAEKLIVQEWAARILMGDSLRSLAHDANANGIPTRTGVRWSPTVIRQILTNPRLAGWRTRHGEIVTEGVWEPLLDETTWQQVRGIINDPSRDKGSRVRRHLLTSLALCGYCRNPVTSKTIGRKEVAHSKYHCPDCGLWRDVTVVNDHVTAYMVELLTRMDDLTELEVPPDSVVAELRQRIQNNVIRFADSDALSDAEFETLQSRLKARLEKEEAKLAVPRRQRLILGMTGPEAAAAWEAASLDRKRRVLDAFVEVRIYRGGPGRSLFDPASIKILKR
jgi:site-specific DNA recombinase